MGIYYLSEALAVWGQHTGYVRLPHYMRRLRPGTRHFQIRHKNRLLNQLGRLIGNHKIRPRVQKYRNLYEGYFYHFYTRRLHAGSIYHLLNFDSTYPFLSRWQKAPRRLIFTLHNPNRAAMTDEYRNFLGRVSSAIVLYRRDLAWYESLIGPGRVKFVHHGVDTDFFHPERVERLPRHPRLLFVGRVFRDTAMLARLLETMTKTMPHLRFDLVVTTSQRRRDPQLQAIAHLPAVTWHSAISDEQLRRLYQQSYLLLLPLLDAGANNALVEALACGLPIVTNDVGGVPDYGGDTIYPTVPRDDDEAMLALIDRYLANFHWRNDVAAAGRDFAETHLAWPTVARKHDDIYRELCR